MENEDSLNSTEEDQIEWISGSSSKRSHETARPTNTNALKVPLTRIHFNSSTSQCITASSERDMAVFFHEKTREVSICLNGMKDEISFGIEEVEEFRIARDASMVFRLRPNFIRSYYHHPEGYSSNYTISKKSDPTGGKLQGIYCVNFKPGNSVDRSKINLVDRLVRKMISISKNPKYMNNQAEARIMKDNDAPYKSSSYRDKIPPIVSYPIGSANSNDPLRDILPESYKNTIKKRELYITCIYPTQKRAIIYSSDGIFSHFQFHIRQRFDWKWERMWYRNKNNGSLNMLNDEDTWIFVKKQAINKPIPRIEVFMR